ILDTSRISLHKSLCALSTEFTEALVDARHFVQKLHELGVFAVHLQIGAVRGPDHRYGIVGINHVVYFWVQHLFADLGKDSGEYLFFAVEIGIERARRYTRLRGDINQTGVQIPIPLKDDPGCLKQLVSAAYTAGSRGKCALYR